jgi:SAM-dependent methyltransferase
MSAAGSTPGEPVERYFDAAAEYWREIYEQSDLQGVIYRRRMETAVHWARELPLAPGSKVLDAGCGAGLLSIELARAGFTVTGTDSSPEMVGLARRAVDELGLAGRIQVQRADVHRLPFSAGEFELAVGLGLLPWLIDPGTAVAELARTLVPGGWMILTADNRRRLNSLIEPRESPVLRPLKLARRRWRAGTGRLPTGAQSRRDLPREVDAMLVTAGVQPVRRATVGYGPFTIMGRRLLPDRAATRVHERLARASEGHPRLRGTGWHYIVQGRKATARTARTGPPPGAGTDA